MINNQLLFETQKARSRARKKRDRLGRNSYQHWYYKGMETAYALVLIRLADAMRERR